MVTSEDDQFQEAYQALIAASGDKEEREAAEELLAEAARLGPADQEEACQVVADVTKYGKRTANNMLKEKKQYQITDSDFNILEIERVIPDAAGSEDYTYVFHVSIDGDEHTFELTSDQLMNPRHFERKVFELAHITLDFEDWSAWLEKTFDNTPITNRSEEPIDTEHGVAEAVMNRVSTLELTDDFDTFRTQPTSHAHLKNGELQVSGEIIADQTESTRGETSPQKLRAILNPVMANGSARKIRQGDDYFRAWRFDADELRDRGIIDGD